MTALPNGPKPGGKTTEFWLTVIAQVLPALAIFGVLTGEEVETLNQAIVEAVKVLGVLVAALVPIWRYIESRTKVKIALS